MREVNPQETDRAYAFEMWMNTPMPMVTFFKTLNVSRLVRISHKSGIKFNMLMCWCIGKAATGVKEFYMLPVGGKLMQYDTLAVLKTTLTVSFQFHHTQMDGAHASRFLDGIQKEMDNLRI